MVTSEPMAVGKQSAGRRSAEPRERAFVMSGDEVRATLAGMKTQARRVCEVQPAAGCYFAMNQAGTAALHLANDSSMPGGIRFVLWDNSDCLRQMRGEEPKHHHIMPCPLGKPGDRLYVRETWAGDDCCGYVYRADHPDADLRAGDLDDGEQSIRRWHSPATMPRNAARLILALAALRVERLQDITVDGIIAEGIPVPPVDYTVPERPDVLDYERKCFAREAFMSRWDRDHRRHPEHQWAANPWVWVPEFTVERTA